MKKIVTLILLSWSWLAVPAACQGLTYYGNDPYAALSEARRRQKMLLVEFYASWNHRSRWMNQQVLGDSSLRPMLEDNFLLVQVPTDTPDGGKLAALYEVTRYPAIVIFNYNGDVLDKIDTTLDREDFEQRIQALLIAMQGGGETWRLRQAYAAAEQGDRESADIYAAMFLASQTPEQVANGVIWPMFENSIVTFYYSSAFDYLLTHLELFRREIGQQRVDEAVSEVLLHAILPYVVGSVPYSPQVTADIAGIASRAGLPIAEMLEEAGEVASLRQADDLSLYIARLGLLIERMPEWMTVPLTLSLDIVADRGTRTQRAAARQIVERATGNRQVPTGAMLLEELRERLK